MLHDYRIVRSRPASLPQQFAVAEVARYLKIMTGTDIPLSGKELPALKPLSWIVLASQKEKISYPGPFDRLRKTEQGFGLRSKNHQLWFVGRSSPDLLYAVYAWLEAQGVFFLRPGREYVPRGKEINIHGFDLEEIPGFGLRGRSFAGWDKVLNMEEPDKDTSFRWCVNTVDWMAKRRMNYVDAQVFLRNMLHQKGEKMRRLFIQEITKRGLMYGVGGHDWAYGAFSRSSQRRFSANPDHFALINGKRSNKQICPSDKEGVELLIETIIKKYRRYPAWQVLTFWPVDALNHWCECGKCKRLSPSDSYVLVVNKLAERVAREFPGRKIHYISYFDTFFPPARIKPNNRWNNLVLEYAPINRMYERSLADLRISKGFRLPEFENNKIDFDKLGLEETWQALRSWRRKHQGPVVAFEYYNCFMKHGITGRPIQVMDKDIAFYHRQGIDLITCEFLNFWPNGFESSFLCHKLWNVNADPKSYRQLFFQKTYGQARQPMLKWAREMTGLFDVAWDQAGVKIKRANNYLQEAQRLQAKDFFAEQIRLARLYTKFVALIRTYAHQSGQDVSRARKTLRAIAQFADNNAMNICKAVSPSELKDHIMPNIEKAFANKKIAIDV